MFVHSSLDYSTAYTGRLYMQCTRSFTCGGQLILSLATWGSTTQKGVVLAEIAKPDQLSRLPLYRKVINKFETVKSYVLQNVFSHFVIIHEACIAGITC